MNNLQKIKDKIEEMKVKYNIEREEEDAPNHSDGFGMFYSGFFTCLKEISWFIDTLEVKQMDFEKEVTNWWNDHYKKINDDYEFGKYNGHYMENSTIINFAKHFFELGMQQSKNEELQ